MKLIVKDIPTNFPIIVRMIFQRTSIWNPAPSEPYPENWWEFQNSVGLSGNIWRKPPNPDKIHEQAGKLLMQGKIEEADKLLDSLRKEHENLKITK